MWSRFGVAQFTPDDPRLAHVEGDDRESIKQRVLRFAAYRFPDGIVCLTTALFIHGLTERCGPDIWMWGTEPPTDTRGLSLFAADPKVFATGHAPYSIDGGDVSVRVTTPARSIVDCFSWHQSAGPKVAEKALRKAIMQGIATPGDILRTASHREVAAPLVAAAMKRLKRSH
jgi:predicted transcriptional regulator of viral defense system